MQAGPVQQAANVPRSIRPWWKPKHLASEALPAAPELVGAALDSHPVEQLLSQHRLLLLPEHLHGWQ